MPVFTASAAIVAGASATPLQNWAYRIPKKAALVEVLVNASAAGLLMNLTTGAESIVQADSVVSGGGTAGTLPARLGTEVIADRVESIDEVVLNLRNPTGGTITYNLVVVMTYL